eukprot:SM000203S06122  [mRNA]  locus=s203:17438:17979:+ [translate_table: standard]
MSIKSLPLSILEKEQSSMTFRCSISKFLKHPLEYLLIHFVTCSGAGALRVARHHRPNLNILVRHDIDKTAASQSKSSILFDTCIDRHFKRYWA